MFLSILVPVYNAEQYLDRCIESILTQKFTDFEVVLVNDGSTDRSGRICDSYAEIDGRIKVVHHKRNEGVVRTRKDALAASRGEYIGTVDSDDEIEPEMFEKLVEAAQKHKADIVMCGVNYTENGAVSKSVPAASGQYGVFDKRRLKLEMYPTMLSYGELFKFGVLPALWNKIYRRELFEKHMSIDDCVMMGEDAVTVYACLAEANQVVVLRECLYNYRVLEGSMTRRYKRGYFRSNIKVFERLAAISETPEISNWDEQCAMYITAMTYSALMNEYSPQSERHGKKRRRAVRAYLKNKYTARALAATRLSRLPAYAVIMTVAVRLRLYMFLGPIMRTFAAVLDKRAKKRGCRDHDEGQ